MAHPKYFLCKSETYEVQQKGRGEYRTDMRLNMTTTGKATLEEAPAAALYPPDLSSTHHFITFTMPLKKSMGATQKDLWGGGVKRAEEAV